MRKEPVFKYTRLEFVASTLNNGVYASPLSVLNDPYEIEGIPSEKDYRVVCLSRSRNQKLMWSHYADGHRGCSIKIILPDDFGTEDCMIKKVRYCSVCCSRKGLNDDELAQSLYKKDKKWSGELEVRAVYYPGNKNDTCWNKKQKKVFYRTEISQIDFGCRAEHDPHYLDALIAIRDFNANHDKKIKVRKYKMNESAFRFEIDKNFDYLSEIESFTK